MRCPACQADCPEQAEACFTCGQALFALTQGALLGGRYEIVRPIGKGGMSRVYHAFDRVLGEAVAIKVLRAELAWEPEMRQRFLHEIRLARRVTHPNVCRIHEYGEDGPRRYISMELVEGVNLKEVLRNRGLSTEEAFDLVLQMADGLGAVHQHGIVHRDFKASNIMVARDGMAKLMDFGIAKHAEGDTSNFTTPGQVLGTPEYMSPEHARGAKVDFRSDIYALGCVVFEIFTGQAPFRGANAFATISKHFYEAPPLDGPLASLIPEPLVPVLRTALAKDPERRYRNVPEAREALRQAQEQAIPQSCAEPSEPNAVGSPRLRRLCEALLAQGLDGTAPAFEADSSVNEITPSPLVPANPPRSAAPPPGADTRAVAAAPRRLRATPMAIAAAAILAIASSMLLWPASRDVGVTPGPVGPARRVEALPAPQPSASSAVAAPTPAPSAAVRAPASTPSPAAAEPRHSPPPPPPRVERTSTALWTTVAPTPPPAALVRAPERPRGPTATTGTLRVLVVPWAELMVDGTSLGTVQLRELTLATGQHSVRILHPDYQPLQRKVTIEAGTVFPLVIDLSEKGIRRVP